MTSGGAAAGRAVLVVSVVAVALAATPGVLAAGGYALDSPSAVDVPTREVSFGGEPYTVEDIARVSPGEDLVLRSTAPADARLRIDLFNSHRMGVLTSDSALIGNDSETLETEGLAPGSYLAVLYEGRGDPRAVLPVVVEGYTAVVDAPETAEAGAEVTVEATLSGDSRAPDPGRVDLVVAERASEEIVRQRTMEGGPDRYTGTVRLDDPGAYELYVFVRGQDSIRDRRVLLGFSDARTLSVTGSASGDGAATQGTDTPAPDTPAPDTTAPATSTTGTAAASDGVITRNATVGAGTPAGNRSTRILSMMFTLFLAAGLGVLLWTRR